MNSIWAVRITQTRTAPQEPEPLLRNQNRHFIKWTVNYHQLNKYTHETDFISISGRLMNTDSIRPTCRKCSVTESTSVCFMCEICDETYETSQILSIKSHSPTHCLSTNHCSRLEDVRPWNMMSSTATAAHQSTSSFNMFNYWAKVKTTNMEPGSKGRSLQS